MIIRAKAPLRLGLAGGGTDISPFCDMYEGAILNVTIDMYAYCIIEPTDDNKIVIDSSDRKEHYVSESKLELDTVEDKVALLAKGVYNRIMKELKREEGLSFKMVTFSDAPVGSGLGASSTMVVAILKAFTEWLNLPYGEYDIARLAFSIEREDLNLHGGKQDQYAATFGGFNFMQFKSNNEVIVNPLKIKNWIKDEIESELILYYTGTSRESAKIIDDQIKNTKKNDKKSLEGMFKLKENAVEMKNALVTANFEHIASLLTEGWLDKKQTASTISNSEIDKMYDYIMNNGARAAKISGAGGGGFMLILCDPKERYNLAKKLEKFDGIVMLPTICENGAKAWTIRDEV